MIKEIEHDIDGNEVVRLIPETEAERKELERKARRQGETFEEALHPDDVESDA